ncbi:hypothetical protein CCACVL1_19588 [Corchorus capsularis]|uniref:Tetratricopeptide-like helical n=1 Tax=Corchorus capsularis TaxID=210143 RepID=A0A1R3HFX3_COCAP|nr:hypothetical protein CCACVL1_19588 [Corchorus capsularis]
MAIGSIFSTLKRSGGDKLSSATWRRLISSVPSPTYEEEKPPVKTASNSSGRRSLLKSGILGLKLPTEITTEVLQEWVDSGHRIKILELRFISKFLLRFKRYNQALQIWKWLETQKGLQLSAFDHANILKLLIKVQGLTPAEDYFDGLPNTASQKAACVPLLHGYVEERNIEKAEALMKAEAVYEEMRGDGNVKVGWSTLTTLAIIYIKAGLVEKAVAALKSAESMLSKRNHFPLFLMTQYATLNHKDEVLQLWEASKEACMRITWANYKCILSCLIKLGDLVEAERVFREWESNCQNYDIRVSNVLLGAYMRNGWVEKAESLHLHTLEKGGCPNYRTWEILAEGWVRSHDMVKAIKAMRNGLPMFKDCHLRPSQSILLAIAEYFEKDGNLEDANNFFRDILGKGLASSPIYKSLLRLHLSAKRPAHDILEMMDKDKIEMDDEISTLVEAFEKQVKLTPEIDVNANAT